MDKAGDLSATMNDAEENASHAVTDCWDDVINFESNSFESGVVDGRSDAIESRDMLENGIQTGFLKGFAYGLELGFMESVSTSQSKSITVNSNNQSSLTGDGTDKAEQSGRENLAFIPSAPNDYSPSTDVNYSVDSGREEHMDLSHEENSLFDSAALPTPSRSLRWCNEIFSRARLVPTKNIDSFDFDKEVRELRGLYKLCGSTVGLFRPTTTDRTDSRIVDPAKKSNEW